jgi:ribose transport system permease protein
MSERLEAEQIRSGLAAAIAPNGWRRLLQDRPLVALVGLMLFLTAIVGILSPGALSPEWVYATLTFAAPLGLIAAGQTLVILTGGIDLSVGVVATVAGYVMATQSPGGEAQAILIGLGLGLLVGLINGLGVAIFQVQPLIMTLGMGLVATGVLNVYAQTTVAAGAVPVVPDIVRELGAGRLAGLVPNSLVLWVLLAVVIILGLKRTGFGRLLYATGNNRVACRLSGVRVWQVLLVTYTLAGLLSAVGGILLCGVTNVADRGLAEPYLLPSVAAVVIGGTSVFGGAGGYSGTFMGAIILTIVAGLLVVLHAPAAIGQIVYGSIILVVAAAYARAVYERS